jgi:DNA polymerase V
MTKRRKKAARPAQSSAPVLYATHVSAGFPAPGDDSVEERLDINRYLIDNPTATFFVRAVGDSMSGAHIATGDILVVDRSVEPRHGMIVVAALMGELVVKRLVVRGRASFLVAEHEGYPSIQIGAEHDCVVWGVVVGVVRKTVT